jgi:hypothetical protein
MTLNLLLTDRHAAYLTGDFRLKYRDRVEDNLLVQKIVPVLKFDWCALVSFCGVALTSSGIDVGDWISQQVNSDNLREHFSDFLTRLRGADKWLAQLSGDNRITISIVGFRHRRPFLICLSNFQYLNGQPFAKPLRLLKLFEMKPTSAEVRVFGDSGSVPDAERGHLRKLSLPDSEGPAVMESLAEANRLAALRSTEQLISPQCVVGRILPTGLGWLRPFGIDPSVEYMPNFIRRDLEASGIDAFELKNDDQGQPLKPGWVQTATRFATLDSGKRVVGSFHEFRNIKGIHKFAR